MEKLHWPFFSLLDFCGKPKPSTEFCMQLLGFARVWSRSDAQTPSYVHVSDSTSWQRVTDAAYRGWRCSTLGCYCSKASEAVYFPISCREEAQKTDPDPLTLFLFAKGLWRLAGQRCLPTRGSDQLWVCALHCVGRNLQTPERGFSEPASLFFWLDSDKCEYEQQQPNSWSQCNKVVSYADLNESFFL